MFDMTIFAVGAFTTLLLGAGLFYTVREFYQTSKSMDREKSSAVEDQAVMSIESRRRRAA